ncbi:MAG: hypothetical protein WCB11_18180 [Terriglobales bacterium]
MTTYLSMTERRRRSTPSFGIGKLLFAIVLAILFFLLGQSMVHHNFHQGMRVHRNGSIGQ